MPTYEVTSPDGKKYRVTAPEGATENDAIDHVRRQSAAAPETWAGLGRDVSHFGERAVRGATALPALALHGVEAATGQGLGELTGGLIKSMSDSEIGRQLENIPEAETTIGRYGGSIAEAAGGLLPGAGAIGLTGRGLARLGLPGAGFLTRAAERPLSGLNLASAAGAGVGAQGAEDLGYEGAGQFVGALAGGIAAPMGAARLGPAVGRALTDAGGAGRIGRPMGPPPGTGGFIGPELPAGPPRPANIPPPMASAVDERTYQVLTDYATKAGISPAQAMTELQDALRSGTFHGGGATASAVDPLMSLAEVNPAFAKAVGAAVRQDPAAATEARAILKARKTGDLPATEAEREAARYAGIPTAEVMDPERYTRAAMKAEPLGIKGRVIQGVRKALRIDSDPHHGFGMDARATDELITRAQEEAARPKYANVKIAGRGVDVGADPRVARVHAAYMNEMNRPGQPDAMRGLIKDAMDEIAPGGRVAARIEDFDMGKRLIDDRINKLLASPDSKAPTMARYLIRMKNNYVRAVDRIEANGLGAMYNDARATFAGPAELRRDLELGRDIYKGDRHIDEFHAADDRAQKNRIKHGYHSAFAHDVMKQQTGADATRLLGSEQKRMELSGLIEKELPGRVYEDRPQRLGRFMQGQAKQIESEKVISGGSQTAERLLDDVQLDVLHRISDIATGSTGMFDVTRRAFEYALNKHFGMPSDVAINLVRKALSADPAVQRRTLHEMQMRWGRSKTQRFLDIMEQQTRGVPVGTVSGVTADLAREQQ